MRKNRWWRRSQVVVSTADDLKVGDIVLVPMQVTGFDDYHHVIAATRPLNGTYKDGVISPKNWVPGNPWNLSSEYAWTWLRQGRKSPIYRLVRSR